MTKFLHIKTAKFPILPGEEELLYNPGTYGKAFAEFVQASLVEAGFMAPSVVCEDWGWWVGVKLSKKSIGITCYRDHDENVACAFAVR